MDWNWNTPGIVGCTVPACLGTTPQATASTVDIAHAYVARPMAAAMENTMYNIITRGIASSLLCLHSIIVTGKLRNRINDGPA